MASLGPQFEDDSPACATNRGNCSKLARCPNQIPCRNSRTSEPVNKPASLQNGSWWLPALLWAGVITFASTDTFSSANTGSLLAPIVRWVYPAIGSEHLEGH